MSEETLILKAQSGTDPEKGDKVLVFTLHDPESDEYKACICFDHDEVSQQYADMPDTFKLIWQAGLIKLGRPEPIALAFLAQPDNVVLWAEPVVTEFVKPPVIH